MRNAKRKNNGSHHFFLKKETRAKYSVFKRLFEFYT